jgi:hypothetical protein
VFSRVGRKAANDVDGCPIYGMLKLQQLVLERRGQWKERRVGPTVPEGV